MPIISSIIKIQDSAANLDYKLVQDKWGISIYTREVGIDCWNEEPFWISKNDISDLIQALRNLQSNW